MVAESAICSDIAGTERRHWSLWRETAQSASWEGLRMEGEAMSVSSRTWRTWIDSRV